MKGNPEEEIEQEQLSDDIDEVETLDEHVDNDEVVAPVSTTPTTDTARETALNTQWTTDLSSTFGVVTLQVPSTHTDMAPPGKYG